MFICLTYPPAVVTDCSLGAHIFIEKSTQGAMLSESGSLRMLCAIMHATQRCTVVRMLSQYFNSFMFLEIQH